MPKKMKAKALLKRDDVKPASIETAYDELTQEEFAVWLRLAVESPDSLEHRGRIAALLNYSPRRSNEILRQLRHKDYIEIQPGESRGIPTRIIIRRPVIVNPRTGHFVRLSA